MKKIPVILLLCIYLLPACTKETATPVNLSVSMLAQVNQLRAAGCTCGTTYMPPVSRLSWDSSLTVAAYNHAKDMYVNNYFDHIAPDGSSPIQRAQAAGFTGQYVGENIAEGFNSLDQVMSAWKNSPDHCMAMMDSIYHVMGAASVSGYWVQEFGD